MSIRPMVVVNYKKERIVSPHEALRCALHRHVLHACRSPRLPPPVPKVVLRLAGKRPKGVRERVECDYKKGITGSLLVTVIIIAVHIVTVIIITVFIRLVIMLRTTILLQPLSC